MDEDERAAALDLVERRSEPVEIQQRRTRHADADESVVRPRERQCLQASTGRLDRGERPFVVGVEELGQLRDPKRRRARDDRDVDPRALDVREARRQPIGGRIELELAAGIEREDAVPQAGRRRALA